MISNRVVQPATSYPAELAYLVRELQKLGAYIAGSYAAWWLPSSGAQPNDIDIFLLDDSPSRVVGVVALVAGFPGVDMESVHETDWSISWDIEGFDPAARIQIVKPLDHKDLERKTYGTPAEVMSKFDLSVVQAVLTPDGIMVGFTTADDIKYGVMRVTCTTTPLYTLQRAMRKAEYFTISEDEILKLLWAWDNLPEDE